MSDQLIKSLVEERANVWEQAKAYLDKSTEEGRAVSAETDETWKRHMDDMDKLDVRVKELVDLEKRNAEADEIRAQYEAKVTDGEQVSEVERFRSWANGGSRTPFDFAPGSLVSPSEMRRNEKYGRELRDQTTTTGAGTIPQGFRNKLWEYAVETSGILQAGVDLLQTTSGETIKLPRVTAYSAVASVSEGSAITESDPTLGSVNSTVSKEGYITQVTTELLQDSAFDLERYLAKWAGRELGNAVGSAAVTAAVAAASAGATTATGELTSLGSQGTAGKGFDYIITLFHSVLAPYRNSSSCAWVMADPAAAMLRKVKSTEGDYVWTASVIPGTPDTILGKPVYIDTYVADPGASAESVLFGDFSSLVVRIAGGFRFERSDEFAFNTDMSTFRAVVRHGSVSVDANALKSLTHAAS